MTGGQRVSDRISAAEVLLLALGVHGRENVGDVAELSGVPWQLCYLSSEFGPHERNIIVPECKFSMLSISTSMFILKIEGTYRQRGPPTQHSLVATSAG